MRLREPARRCTARDGALVENRRPDDALNVLKPLLERAPAKLWYVNTPALISALMTRLISLKVTLLSLSIILENRRDYHRV